jgi:hypothetical protein
MTIEAMHLGLIAVAGAALMVVLHLPHRHCS